MLTDVQYALRQLRGIVGINPAPSGPVLNRPQRASYESIVDRAQRAIDALERVEQELLASKSTEPTQVDTSKECYCVVCQDSQTRSV